MPTETTPPPTEADAIAALAIRGHGSPSVIEHAGQPFLVLPKTFDLKSLADPLGLTKDPLKFIRQPVTLQTVDSLVAYVDRFKDRATALFADIAKNTIVAVIDYHGARADNAEAKASPSAHRVSMVLPFSEEWGVWSAISGKLMEQQEFARFVEENAGDVSVPAGAELLEVCRDLQAARKADFSRVVRTNGDDESFEFTESTDARTKSGSVEVPTRFELTIPVYFGSRTVEMVAFLRWKLNDGQLLLGAKIHRPEHVRQAMFREIVDDAAGRTGCPVFYGVADVVLHPGVAGY